MLVVLVLNDSVKAVPIAVTVQDATFDLASRRVALPDATSLTVTGCTVRGAGVLAVNLTAMIEAAVRNDTASDTVLKVDVLIQYTSFWSLSQLHLELPASAAAKVSPLLNKPLHLNVEIRNCSFNDSVVFVQDIGALASVGSAAPNRLQLVVAESRWLVETESTLLAALPPTHRNIGQTFAACIVLGNVSGVSLLRILSNAFDVRNSKSLYNHAVLFAAPQTALLRYDDLVEIANNEFTMAEATAILVVSIVNISDGALFSIQRNNITFRSFFGNPYGKIDVMFGHALDIVNGGRYSVAHNRIYHSANNEHPLVLRHYYTILYVGATMVRGTRARLEIEHNNISVDVPSGSGLRGMMFASVQGYGGTVAFRSNVVRLTAGDSLRLLWIMETPMSELRAGGKLDFSHNSANLSAKSIANCFIFGDVGANDYPLRVYDGSALNILDNELHIVLEAGTGPSTVAGRFNVTGAGSTIRITGNNASVLGEPSGQLTGCTFANIEALHVTHGASFVITDNKIFVPVNSDALTIIRLQVAHYSVFLMQNNSMAITRPDTNDNYMHGVYHVALHLSNHSMYYFLNNTIRFTAQRSNGLFRIEKELTLYHGCRLLLQGNTFYQRALIGITTTVTIEAPATEVAENSSFIIRRNYFDVDHPSIATGLGFKAVAIRSRSSLIISDNAFPIHAPDARVTGIIFTENVEVRPNSALLISGNWFNVSTLSWAARGVVFLTTVSVSTQSYLGIERNVMLVQSEMMSGTYPIVFVVAMEVMDSSVVAFGGNNITIVSVAANVNVFSAFISSHNYTLIGDNSTVQITDNTLASTQVSVNFIRFCYTTTLLPSYRAPDFSPTAAIIIVGNSFTRPASAGVVYPLISSGASINFAPSTLNPSRQFVVGCNTYNGVLIVDYATRLSAPFGVDKVTQTLQCSSCSSPYFDCNPVASHALLVAPSCGCACNTGYWIGGVEWSSPRCYPVPSSVAIPSTKSPHQLHTRTATSSASPTHSATFSSTELHSPTVKGKTATQLGEKRKTEKRREVSQTLNTRNPSPPPLTAAPTRMPVRTATRHQAVSKHRSLSLTPVQHDVPPIPGGNTSQTKVRGVSITPLLLGTEDDERSALHSAASSAIANVISQAAAQAIVTTGVSSTAVAGVLSPTASSQAVRVGSVAGVTRCAFTDLELQPSHFEHPLRTCIGSGSLCWYVGSSLLTTAVFVVFPSLALAVAAKVVASGKAVTISKGATFGIKKVGGTAVALFQSYFAAGIVKAAVLCTTHPTEAGGAVGVAIAVACGLVTVVLIAAEAFVMYRLLPQYMFVELDGRGKVLLSPAPGRSPVPMLMAFMFVDAAKNPLLARYRLFFFEDVLATCLLGLIDGIRPESSCASVAGVMLAICSLHLAFLVVVRPYRSKLETLFVTVAAAILVVIAVCALVITLEKGSTGVLTTAEKVLGIAAIVESGVFFGQMAVLGVWVYYVTERRRVARLHGSDSVDASSADTPLLSLDDSLEAESGGRSAASNPLLKAAL